VSEEERREGKTTVSYEVDVGVPAEEPFSPWLKCNEDEDEEESDE